MNYFKTNRYLIVLFTLLVTGCGTTPIQHQSSFIEINEAKVIAEDLTFSQHADWKPDYFSITKDYFSWDFGNTARKSMWSNSFVVKNNKDRSYYRSIKDVNLSSWKRKFQQWYVVSLIDNDGNIKHILRTQELGDAELFTDAITSIVSYYKK